MDQFTINFTKTSGNIRKLAQDLNSVYTKEDIEQELWLKVVTLEAEDDSQVSYTTLQNRLIDIIRHQTRRPDTSFYAKKLDEDNNSLIEDFEDATFHEGSVFRGFDEFESEDMQKDLLAWAETQPCEDTRRFLKEAIEPSPKVLEIWEELKAKSARYRGFDDIIPPFTLRTILGISKSKLYHILSQIRNHLNND